MAGLPPSRPGSPSAPTFEIRKSGPTGSYAPAVVTAAMRLAPPAKTAAASLRRRVRSSTPSRRSYRAGAQPGSGGFGLGAPVGGRSLRVAQPGLVAVLGQAARDDLGDAAVAHAHAVEHVGGV